MIDDMAFRNMSPLTQCSRVGVASAFGTFRKCRNVRLESGLRTKPTLLGAFDWPWRRTGRALIGPERWCECLAVLVDGDSVKCIFVGLAKIRIQAERTAGRLWPTSAFFNRSPVGANSVSR
jgi:hypothetical protein